MYQNGKSSKGTDNAFAIMYTRKDARIIFPTLETFKSTEKFLLTTIAAILTAMKDAIVVESAAPFRPYNGMRIIQRIELSTTPRNANNADVPGLPELLIIVDRI